MYIFYDFETSTKELLGQILSFAFIVCNEEFIEVDRFCGYVKVKRLELPSVGAILTNQLNIDDLNHQGEDEHQVAKNIYNFLDKIISQYHEATLCGFNSNQFDLNFLRNCLLKYGINPYFKGKLKNKDVLHFCQDIAINHPDTFPWKAFEKNNEEGIPYYSFKLENLAKQFDCLHESQSHDAIEDVLLTIKLVKKLQKLFKANFQDFQPFHLEKIKSKKTTTIFKQKIKGTPPTPLSIKKWLLIKKIGKNHLFVDLDITKENKEVDPLHYIRNINENKQYFIATELEASKEELNHIESILQVPLIKKIQSSQANYFDLIKKDWDIEYQIHILGFSHIPILENSIRDLHKAPANYPKILKKLLDKRNQTQIYEEKEAYFNCIKLFNRFYLNFHPNPSQENLNKYIIPRYITGQILKNWDHDFESIEFQYEALCSAYEENPKAKHLEALKRYYIDFCDKHNLQLQINNA